MNTTNLTEYGGLHIIDYSIIITYIAIAIIIGLSFARRGTKDTRAFFIGSSSIPWWLIGIALLASCFAADTPLWIGSIIYKRGIEGAWLYWANGIGVAFYILAIAPLWRRTGVVTEPEFFEMRYSGGAATFLRGFNSLYTSMFVNILMMAVSTLSIAKILQNTTGYTSQEHKIWFVLITMGAGLSYCAISGIWGCAASDLMHFFVTFIGSLILAGFTIYKAGGVGSIVANVNQLTDWVGHDLNILPGLSADGLPLMTVIFLFTLKWIEQTGCGGYVAQKLFAAKTPKESVWTALVWGSMYFSVIPLPWIITIVASKFMIPGITDGQDAYPRMIMHILPIGLRGVLIASLVAAFMSAFSSLLNWGSSYFVNDFYKRFLVKNKSEHHYVRISQFINIPMVIVAGCIAFLSDSILNLLFIPLAFGAGGTTLALARWIWWRPNQWSEVAATIASMAITLFVSLAFPKLSVFADADTSEYYYGARMTVIIIGTFLVWVAVTLLTKPVDAEKLNNFYKKVRPPLFWGHVRNRLGLKKELSFSGILYGWITLLVAIFCPLFGLLKIVFGQPILGLFLVITGFFGLSLAIKRANVIYNETAIQAAEKK